MKVAIFLITILVVFSSCSSSRLLERGDYDGAIEKAVQNLRKDPGDVDEILVLDRAYKVANELDRERIRFLKLENDPRNTDEILHLYTSLKNRQTLVRTVLPLHLPDSTIEYQYVDYDREIIDAKLGAAEYYYENALRLMELNEKKSYRQAYYELLKVDEYTSNYEDTEYLLHKARRNGISRALVAVKNHTHLNLSPAFKNELLAVDTRRLNRDWVEFHFRDLDETIDYDYYIIVNLGMIDVSPNATEEKDTIIKKQIEDGFEYLLDEKGNVMKDSLGNDIKIPKYKQLVCTVIETLQIKEAFIEGDIEFFSETPSQLMKKEPVGAASLFEHSSARAIGDTEALDEETLKKVGVEPLPFPDDAEMIFRTAETLREAISQAIRSNRLLIQ